MPDRPRVIIALPDRSEGAVIADCLLSEGFTPVQRTASQPAADEMLRPFALLIADASFRRLYQHCRARSPLTPAILIGNDGTACSANPIGAQTTYLSRPVDHTLLGCFVSMAILDSRRARRSARKPVDPLNAVANGVPAHIVDVSPEGLRLELPRARQSALPPYFTVRVPIVGLAVTVQRMWSKAPDSGAAICYGAALSRNRAGVDQAWRAFVEHVPAACDAGIVLHP